MLDLIYIVARIGGYITLVSQ